MFHVLNDTYPNITLSCWLCYDIAPPYYEGIALLPSNISLFYWINSLFTFKCCPLSWYTPQKSHNPCPPVPVSQSTLSHFPVRIPPHCSIQAFQDRAPLLPLISNKAILCCICFWSHGLLHLHSLVDVFVPGSLGVLGGSYQHFQKDKTATNKLGKDLYQPYIQHRPTIQDIQRIQEVRLQRAK